MSFTIFVVHRYLYLLFCILVSNPCNIYYVIIILYAEVSLLSLMSVNQDLLNICSNIICKTEAHQLKSLINNYHITIIYTYLSIKVLND